MKILVFLPEAEKENLDNFWEFKSVKVVDRYMIKINSTASFVNVHESIMN